MILSNMGHICKICEKDGRYFTIIMIFIHSFRFITMKLVIIATFPEQFLQVRISKKATKI